MPVTGRTELLLCRARGLVEVGGPLVPACVGNAKALLTPDAARMSGRCDGAHVRSDSKKFCENRDATGHW